MRRSPSGFKKSRPSTDSIKYFDASLENANRLLMKFRSNTNIRRENFTRTFQTDIDFELTEPRPRPNSRLALVDQQDLRGLVSDLAARCHVHQRTTS